MRLVLCAIALMMASLAIAQPGDVTTDATGLTIADTTVADTTADVMTEPSTEPPTDPPTDPPTEASTADSTAAPTEPATDASTAAPTEASTEASTAAPTEASAAASTDASTAASTATETSADSTAAVTTAETTSTTVTSTETTAPQPTTPAPRPTLNMTFEGPQSLYAGQTGQISYNLVVCNSGPGAASDVVVKGSIPQTALQSGLASGLRLQCNGQQDFECDVTGQLLPNSCVEVLFFVYVLTTETQSSFTMSGSAETSSAVTAGSVLSNQFSVRLQILSDVQFVRPQSVIVTAGAQQRYEVTLANFGPSQCYGVNVTTVSPFPIAAVAAQGDAQCTIQPDRVTLVCKLGNLPVEVGGARGLTVSLVFTAPANHPQTISSAFEAPSSDALLASASFVTSSTLVNPAARSRQYQIDVLRVSDLVLAANCSLLSSSFIIVNNGPSDCSSYSLQIVTSTSDTANLPAECVRGAASVTCTGSLALGESLSLKVAGSSNETVVATVSSPTDPSRESNARTCKLGVLVVEETPLASYFFTRSLSATSSLSWSLANGTQLQWLVTCNNTSPSSTALLLGTAAAPYGTPLSGGSWITGNSVSGVLLAWIGAHSNSTGASFRSGVARRSGSSLLMWGMTDGLNGQAMVTVMCPSVATRLATERWAGSVAGFAAATANVDFASGYVVAADPALITAHAALMGVAWFVGVLAVLLAMRLTAQHPQRAWIVLVATGATTAVAIAGFVIGCVMSPVLWNMAGTRSLGAHGIIGLVAFILLLVEVCLAAAVVVFKGQSVLEAVELAVAAAVMVLGVVAAFLGIYDWGVSAGWYALLAGWLALAVLAAVALELRRRLSEKEQVAPKLEQYFAQSTASVSTPASLATTLDASPAPAAPAVAVVVAATVVVADQQRAGDVALEVITSSAEDDLPTPAIESSAALSRNSGTVEAAAAASGDTGVPLESTDDDSVVATPAL